MINVGESEEIDSSDNRLNSNPNQDSKKYMIKGNLNLILSHLTLFLLFISFNTIYSLKI